MLEIENFDIEGPVLIKPKVFRDNRGHFFESYHREAWHEIGLTRSFVQDNESRSCRNVLRGLHYQVNPPQGKLVRVAWGTVFDVAVDIRPGSPTFGRWISVELSDANHYHLYIPEGFAHGFQVLSDEAVFLYKVTAQYAPAGDRGVLWSDPELAIPWPARPPIFSEKDRRLPFLKDLDASERRV